MGSYSAPVLLAMPTQLLAINSAYCAVPLITPSIEPVDWSISSRNSSAVSGDANWCNSGRRLDQTQVDL